MATLLLSSEDQLQRLNALVADIKAMQSLDQEQLMQQPAPGKWSIVEIVGHMNAAYDIYRDRIDTALAASPIKETANGSFRARWVPKLFIKMIRPQEGQRKWKMKTMRQFEPEEATKASSEAEMERVFQTFFDHNEHLRQAILNSRNRNVRQAKVVSGIGPLVQFYLPECFDFLISHEERHVLQAKETARKIRGRRIISSRF